MPARPLLNKPCFRRVLCEKNRFLGPSLVYFSVQYWWLRFWGQILHDSLRIAGLNIINFDMSIFLTRWAELWCFWSIAIDLKCFSEWSMISLMFVIDMYQRKQSVIKPYIENFCWASNRSTVFHCSHDLCHKACHYEFCIPQKKFFSERPPLKKRVLMGSSPKKRLSLKDDSTRCP